jgi:hypothetical protein
MKRTASAFALAFTTMACGPSSHGSGQPNSTAGSSSGTDAAPGNGSGDSGGGSGSGAQVAGSQSTSESSSGVSSTHGSSGSSGSSSSTGSSSSSSDSGASSGSSDGGASCPTSLPAGGAQTCLGSSNQYASGPADGLTWTEWTNGNGGCITTYDNATAYGASWNNPGDYLARLGLNFSGSEPYASYGTITAQFAETKTGSAGSYSYVGIYGWMWNPCVEYYIVDDSFDGLSTSGTETTIDGAVYYVSTNTTGGSGGNSCEPGHAGNWAQMWSVSKTPRPCGTIKISDHFAAWAQQGWALGDLSSAQINVEVGGGTGSIDFTIANVTTTAQ